MVPLKYLIFIILLTNISFSYSKNQNSCQIRIQDLNPEPIVVLASDPTRFLYPDPATGLVTLPHLAALLVACPGTTLTLNASTPTSTLQITCLSNQTFAVAAPRRRIHFYDLRCARKVTATARPAAAPCSPTSNATQLLAVGFALAPALFLPLYRVCFDRARHSPLYAASHLYGALRWREHGVRRPHFRADLHPSAAARLRQLYALANQTRAVNALLRHLPANSTRYVRARDFRLSRGHLAAKADFVYAPQQLATFYYVNTAPQWQVVNGRGWQRAEAALQRLAAERGADFVVYSGVWGVAQLRSEETGEPVELYLGEGGAVPVPGAFWKMALDVGSERGVVLVSGNNPYMKLAGLCEDVSERLDWLKWEKGVGGGCACSVREFRKVCKDVPVEYDDYGLL